MEYIATLTALLDYTRSDNKVVIPIMIVFENFTFILKRTSHKIAKQIVRT